MHRYVIVDSCFLFLVSVSESLSPSLFFTRLRNEKHTIAFHGRPSPMTYVETQLDAMMKLAMVVIADDDNVMGYRIFLVPRSSHSPTDTLHSVSSQSDPLPL